MNLDHREFVSRYPDPVVAEEDTELSQSIQKTGRSVWVSAVVFILLATIFAALSWIGRDEIHVVVLSALGTFLTLIAGLFLVRAVLRKTRRERNYGMMRVILRAVAAPFSHRS